jgi:hypothetical protein
LRVNGVAWWENFEVVLNRAVESCKTTDIMPLDYFREVTKMIISGYTDYTFGSSVLNVGQWMNNQDFPGFANLWFYCKLRVFGKGNMVLPY